MKLFIKEKLFSLHNKYFIYNEVGEEIYSIESKAISFGDKTTVYDNNRNIITYIEQEVFHFMSHYNVFINDEVKFNIKKKFHFMKNDYELSNGYYVEGSMFSLDYSIKDNSGSEIASINRKFISLGDKYNVEVYDESKLDIILSIIVCITNDIDRSQSNSAASST